MSTLLCFGFGYCAEHFIAAFGNRFDHVVGTVRGVERMAILNAYERPRLRALIFDGKQATTELRNAIGAADHILVSVPPGGDGDPALAACATELAAAKDLRSIVYLSTVGVYGDRQGGWVDETTAPQPDAGRSHDRLLAERAWQEFGVQRNLPVAILRLAGIYGPGQNALIQIASGKARCVVKLGQVFNRIHVDDIAQAIDAAFARRASGIFNIADDEPTPPGEPIAYAAQLMGREPPPEIPFEEAKLSMSPMALSFWQDCRRVKNEKLKRELGVSLRYPTYREGLKALLADDALSASSVP